MTDPGPTLIALARAAITRSLGLPVPGAVDRPTDLDLSRPGASFVTLTQGGQLRGCIGSLEAYRPLSADVEANALAAAFRDPRFPPLTPEEWPSIRVEISLLTAPQPMIVQDEADLRRQLRPGIDGLIFSARGRRATFLPQVWEQLPEVERFLSHLRQKAGLPGDYWGSDVEVSRYQVQKWKEAA